MIEMILLIMVVAISIHIIGVLLALFAVILLFAEGDLRTKKDVKDSFFGGFVWPYIVFKLIKEEWDRLPEG